GGGGVRPQDAHVLDDLRELLLKHLEDGGREIIVIVGDRAIRGGKVRQLRVERIGHIGHFGAGDERFLGRVVQREAADEGEVVLDLGGGVVGDYPVAIGAVLGVELDLAPIHPAEAVHVVEVRLRAILGALEQARDRQGQIINLTDVHGSGRYPWRRSATGRALAGSRRCGGRGGGGRGG